MSDECFRRIYFCIHYHSNIMRSVWLRDGAPKLVLTWADVENSTFGTKITSAAGKWLFKIVLNQVLVVGGSELE